MEEQRIIKKYPNRRLYDTAISNYITLDDVKELVLSCTNFKVIDARSQEDITHNTLLQIINEQEESGSPMLTNETLQQLIRHYGNSMQGMMSAFLEQSVQMMLQQQDTLTQRFNTFMDTNPLNFINEMAKQNMAVWQQAQENLVKGTAFLSPAPASSQGSAPGSDDLPAQDKTRVNASNAKKPA